MTRTRILVSITVGLAVSAAWLAGIAVANGQHDHEHPPIPPAYANAHIPTHVWTDPMMLAKGKEIFTAKCALCHGERGDGRGVRREGLPRSLRDFTSAAWRGSTSPRRVYYAIREGVPSTPMPNWKALSEQDAWDMTAYVLSISERP